MVAISGKGLAGKRVLVVEDEYTVATDLVRTLQDAGAEVIGPAGNVGDALELVEQQRGRMDRAVLDVNLRDELVYPVADALAALHVPFILATGYEADSIPPTYAGIPRCVKPVNKVQLIRLLATARATDD
jgi:CheY-like chemotaxis protein